MRMSSLHTCQKKKKKVSPMPNEYVSYTCSCTNKRCVSYTDLMCMSLTHTCTSKKGVSPIHALVQIKGVPIHNPIQTMDVSSIHIYHNEFVSYTCSLTY